MILIHVANDWFCFSTSVKVGITYFHLSIRDLQGRILNVIVLKVSKCYSKYRAYDGSCYKFYSSSSKLFDNVLSMEDRAMIFRFRFDKKTYAT